jgi:hypothetical protein
MAYNVGGLIEFNDFYDLVYGIIPVTEYDFGTFDVPGTAPDIDYGTFDAPGSAPDIDLGTL